MSLFDFAKKQEQNSEVEKKDYHKADEKAEGSDKGGFLGFILLSEPEWNKAQLINDLHQDWEIDASGDNGMAYSEAGKDIIWLERENMRTVISFIPVPIPGGEAEHYAAANYMWPKAVDAAKVHKAQLIVAVLGDHVNVYEQGKMLVKVIASCCKQKYASGVYTSGAVFQPGLYYDLAMLMKEGELPILNWIWFGVYRNEGRAGVYTYGMKLFGKDEMEVYAENANLNDIRDFLIKMVGYVLEGDVTLHDGETIGFSAEQKLPITRSKGIALDGMTLKIRYEG